MTVRLRRETERQGRAMPSEKHLLEARKTKSYLYFALERAGDVLVVVLGKSLDSLCGSDLLEERSTLLEEVRDPAIRAVVFDFANVEYFDSLVLDTLCQVSNHLRERGGKMALCNLSEVGAEILRMSRLDVLWRPHSSRLCALEALASTENAIRTASRQVVVNPLTELGALSNLLLGKTACQKTDAEEFVDDSRRSRSGIR
jgi:anti-anti-sigma factor